MVFVVGRGYLIFIFFLVLVLNVASKRGKDVTCKILHISTELKVLVLPLDMKHGKSAQLKLDIDRLSQFRIILVKFLSFKIKMV